MSAVVGIRGVRDNDNTCVYRLNCLDQVMIKALRKPCPQPTTRLPEPKLVAFREEVRDHGNTYAHRMYVMRPKLATVIERQVGTDNLDMAMGMRAAVRKQLLAEFWRRLGAA